MNQRDNIIIAFISGMAIFALLVAMYLMGQEQILSLYEKLGQAISEI